MATGLAARVGSASTPTWPVSEAGQADSLASTNGSGDITAARKLISGSTGGVQNAGGFPSLGAVSNKTTSFTADSVFFLYTCNTAGGSITVTLPAASGNTGLAFAFKKTSASNSLIIDPNASETADSATTLTTTADDAAIVLVCDGTEWHSVSRYGTWT